jgi:putative hydrolase of HD superfamily
MNERLSKQLEFLKTADALKRVSRKTSILGGERLENSAEHTWHVILTAMTIAEHSNEQIDLTKVLQMLALHDLGELEMGDTFHYDKSEATNQKENECAEKLFSLLPPDQNKIFYNLWKEFELRETSEARFAAAIDRLWPCIQNYANSGGTWIEFKISLEKAIERNKHIEDGSVVIWKYVESLLRNANEENLMYVQKEL